MTILRSCWWRSTWFFNGFGLPRGHKYECITGRHFPKSQIKTGSFLTAFSTSASCRFQIAQKGLKSDVIFEGCRGRQTGIVSHVAYLSALNDHERLQSRSVIGSWIREVCVLYKYHFRSPWVLNFSIGCIRQDVLYFLSDICHVHGCAHSAEKKWRVRHVMYDQLPFAPACLINRAVNVKTHKLLVIFTNTSREKERISAKTDFMEVCRLLRTSDWSVSKVS